MFVAGLPLHTRKHPIREPLAALSAALVAHFCSSLTLKETTNMSSFVLCWTLASPVSLPHPRRVFSESLTQPDKHTLAFPCVSDPLLTLTHTPPDAHTLTFSHSHTHKHQRQPVCPVHASSAALRQAEERLLIIPTSTATHERMQGHRNCRHWASCMQKRVEQTPCSLLVSGNK